MVLAMPPSLMERAERLLAGDRTAAEVTPARPAATVALLRAGSDGFEVFLQRRLASMAFAARMHVFPGGVVDRTDRDFETGLAGPNAEESVPSSAGSFGRDCLAARAAAVRETMEETGYDIGDPRSLAYIAHWVTPEVEPRRYDTRFYATVISCVGPPPPQLAEADEACWITPGDALARYGAGEMAMLPPTVGVLSQLAELAAQQLGPHEAVARAGSQVIRPMLPAPRRDVDAPHGIAWVVVDACTGEQIVPAPA